MQLRHRSSLNLFSSALSDSCRHQHCNIWEAIEVSLYRFGRENERPLAASARRIRSRALGPIPCSCKTCSSLTLVNCSSLVYPAPVSALSAGLANPAGRSLSSVANLFFFMDQSASFLCQALFDLFTFVPSLVNRTGRLRIDTPRRKNN
jgi:hypothetical protein